MTRKLLSILSGGLFVLAAGAVSAEPVKLAPAQLDSVTAGAAFSFASADGFAFGTRNAATATRTNTVAISGYKFNLAASSSRSASVAN